MKSAFALSFLSAVSVAQLIALDPLGPLSVSASCQCPQVKCPAYDVTSLCNCLNNREEACHKRCTAYKPTYLACPPTAPPVSLPVPLPYVTPVPLPFPLSVSLPTSLPIPIPVPTKPTPLVLPPQPTLNATCECEGVFCIQAWPQSCYCANAGKQACYEKCGGVKPVLQSCPAYDEPTLLTLPPVYQPTSIYKPPTRPSTTKSSASPIPTHARCGGGRAGSNVCAQKGYICIDDPFSSGCGMACDGPGICVDSNICGGFAGFSCPYKGQMCMDNPTDDCDPENGDNDCAGVCVWPHDDGYNDNGQPL